MRQMKGSPLPHQSSHRGKCVQYFPNLLLIIISSSSSIALIVPGGGGLVFLGWGTVWKMLIQSMKYIFLSFRELFYFSLVFLFGLAVPHGLWDLSSQPRIEPKPPAVKHGVLTTGLPGNSESSFILVCMYVCIQKQKNCSLNSDKWIPVCKLCYVKRACISLGYW